MAAKKQMGVIADQEKRIRKEIDKLRVMLEDLGGQIKGSSGTDAVFDALKHIDVMGNDPIDSFKVDIALWALISSVNPLGNDPIDSFSIDDFQKLALEVLGNDPIDSHRLDLLVRIAEKTRESLVASAQTKAKKVKKSVKKNPKK